MPDMLEFGMLVVINYIQMGPRICSSTRPGLIAVKDVAGVVLGHSAKACKVSS